MYLTDMHTEDEVGNLMVYKLFKRLLSKIVKRNVLLHFKSDSDVSGFMKEAGFKNVTMHDPVNFSDQIDIPSTKYSILKVAEGVS